MALILGIQQEMGCIGSKVSGDADDGPGHPEQRQPLLQNSEDSEYRISPLAPDSPMINSTQPATLHAQQRAGGRNGMVVDASRFERSEVITSGKSPETYTSTHLNRDSFSQSLPYNTTHIPNNQRLSSSENHANQHITRLARNQEPVSVRDVRTTRGKTILESLQEAYNWRAKYSQPVPEFLSLMDRLYMECQLHLTALSSRTDELSRREVDMIVEEMITLRNHWGQNLLPNSICNAFVRERIPLTLGHSQRQFRIDCAQFFEPVPFYGNQPGNPGELMKLYRFSIYDLSRNEVVLRYYLERSNVTQVYHVLCFTCDNYRGQVSPYGSECPSYWEIREHMLTDVNSRLLSALSNGAVQAPQPHAATIFPTVQGDGPIIIQIPAQRPVPVQN